MVRGEFPAIEGVEIAIRIDDAVEPVVQSERRISEPMQELTSVALDELEAVGIIEKVEEFAEW